MMEDIPTDLRRSETSNRINPKKSLPRYTKRTQKVEVVEYQYIRGKGNGRKKGRQTSTYQRKKKTEESEISGRKQ